MTDPAEAIDTLPPIGEIERIEILVKRADSPDLSRLVWTERELAIESTRRSVVLILRGMALKLEGERA